MTRFLFVSDLHGRPGRYAALLEILGEDPPDAVLLGGDLLPHHLDPLRGVGGGGGGFLEGWLAPRLEGLLERLGERAPAVLAVPGNDDAGDVFLAGSGHLESRGLWRNVHGSATTVRGWTVVGYGCVPPTPFLLKDWERYDVSRYVDPGCVSPEDGVRTFDVDADVVRHGTIAGDLEELAARAPGPVDRVVGLFHAPPYRTCLDRAALDGRFVDHVPVDVHVGSVAVRRWIESHAPPVTLHGHVHETHRLTGEWRELIGATWALSAAHDGPGLAAVVFDPSRPDRARRLVVPCPPD